MKTIKQFLLIDQADRKLQPFKVAGKVIVPSRGWINTIRNALNMSLSKTGKRLGITAPSVKEMEEREVSGSITLNTLREAGKALDMRLVYGFVPQSGSIRKTISNRAKEVATHLVSRTSQHMRLEDQLTTDSQLKKAIKLKTDEIIASMPKILWD